MRIGTTPDTRVSPDANPPSMIVSRKILHDVLSQHSVSVYDIVQSRENCRLIIQAMTPAETIIAICRWHQLPDTIPAAILGVSPDSIRVIMHRFKRRLIAQYPHLRVSIEGRRHTSPTS